VSLHPAGPTVGTIAEPFPDVTRIAVLRSGGLGDLIGSLPAAEALAATYPGAEITLLGTPAAAALLGDRPSPFGRIEVLPPHPGVRDGAADPAATEAFLARMRAHRFDLAVQIHGGGRNSNPYLLALGARHTVGTRTDDAAPLERNLGYVYYQHEVLRALEVVGLAGAMPVRLEPHLVRLPAESTGRDPGRRPLVTVHPGASDPRRRWPAERFGALAAALAEEHDAEVVVVGDPAEQDLAAEVVRHARRHGAPAERVDSRAGQLSLPELAVLLAGSTLVVANDSGPRHLAAALGTPTVGLYWFGNVVNFGPLSRARHRVQLGWTTHCPVCGLDCTQVGWTAERCPHDDSFIAGIRLEDVLADAAALLAQPAPVRAS
jgi:ADP-heptose:LPS heptosyltransferase